MPPFIAHHPFPLSQFPTGVFWGPLPSELLVLKPEFQSGFCRNPNANHPQSCARRWGNLKTCSLRGVPGPVVGKEAPGAGGDGPCGGVAKAPRARRVGAAFGKDRSLGFTE